jgi:hypothetical protein
MNKLSHQDNKNNNKNKNDDGDEVVAYNAVHLGDARHDVHLEFQARVSESQRKSFLVSVERITSNDFGQLGTLAPARCPLSFPTSR